MIDENYDITPTHTSIYIHWNNEIFFSSFPGHKRDTHRNYTYALNETEYKLIN